MSDRSKQKTKAERQAEAKTPTAEKIAETRAEVGGAEGEVVTDDGEDHTTTGKPAESTAPVETSGKTKSIVDPKYASRYKTDNDGLAKFLNDQCKGSFRYPQVMGADNKHVDDTTKDKSWHPDPSGEFDYGRYFKLCLNNGLKEEHIEPYRVLESGGDDAKVNGLAGRARMTLRNRLAPLVRKAGKLVGVDGEEHSDLTVAPLPARQTAGTAEAAASVPNNAGNDAPAAEQTGEVAKAA